MKFEISEREIIACAYFQPILGVLKDKGAPIDGQFVLSVRNGFKVTSIDNFNSITFIFEEEK